ncbi:pumilio homolog 12-like, partial [Neltuma alba]|uniref:pumilio homolog 12-like n=1 Tax=Neltuma alba TaxID=207710 RepID=UPI0010A4ABE8
MILALFLDNVCFYCSDGSIYSISSNVSPSDDLPACRTYSKSRKPPRRREYHDHVGNPMSEIDRSSLTSQPRTQISLNSIEFDENINFGPLHPLEAQLQSLRIDSVGEGLLHENRTNQQTLAGNSRPIEPRHIYDGALYRYNITNKQILAAGNFGIGPSHDYARLLHENNTNQQNTNQQTLVGNFGIGPHHLVYEGLSQCNNANNETLVIGNPRIGPSPVFYNSPVGRILQRYNDITSLEVMRGRVVSMSKEEYGSEFLVRLLDGKNPRDIKFILMELLNHLHDLMMDQFGKCVIEKIFDVLNEDQITLLFELITEDLPKFQIACKNNIGLFIRYTSMQSYTKYDRSSYDRKAMDCFTYALREIVVPVATSHYGSYAILDAMASECTLVATNKSGCFVLQKCLSISTLELSYLLICAVTNRVTVLAPHQYGNYVVQYVIKLRLGEVNEAIVNRLRGCYVDLSVNKQASNVVENLLIFSTQKNVGIIVQEIINSPSFLYLLQDPFGNYVAQTALECSKGALYDALVSTISKHYRILCTDQYGKR